MTETGPDGVADGGNDAGDRWRRLRDGDQSARVALYEKHHEALRRWFRAKLPAGVDADDCVSEVFVRALDGIERNTQITDGVDQWLWGIARYVLTEHYRVKDRRTDRQLEDVAPALDDPNSRTSALTVGTRPPEPGLRYGKQQAFAALYTAADSLSAKQRTVVTAYLDRSIAEMRECKGAELAAHLGWSPDETNTELHRAKTNVLEQVGLLAVARAVRSCPNYAELATVRGMFHGEVTGPDVVPTRKGYRTLRKHAPDCTHCSQVMRDARWEKQWALGPGIALVAAHHNADDDERRRAIVAWWSGRAPSSTATAPPPPAAVAELGAALGSAGTASGGRLAEVTRTVGELAGAAVRPVASAARTARDAVLRQLLRVPGVGSALNTATRVAAENPLAVRLVGAVTALAAV
ncbi:MAG: sigma-70 family RNA polymerase sigma factor, partial [Streptomycetaceae bacterium]|nr:sigma-70 family RNA polymerase sigma factor [Streptomycetaceae bacterium]